MRKTVFCACISFWAVHCWQRNQAKHTQQMTTQNTRYKLTEEAKSSVLHGDGYALNNR